MSTTPSTQEPAAEPTGSPFATAGFAAGLLVLPQHNWKWFLLRGLIAIALGIVALFLPGFTLLTFALLFAAFSFADGILSLIAGIRGASHHTDRWGALIFSGVTGILVGLVFFIWPLLATATYAFLLVVLIAFWAFVTGAFEISAAIRLRKTIEGEWLLGIAGGLSILLSLALIALLVASPIPTLLSIGWLIGLYMLASGFALLVLAFRLKRREG